MTTICATKSEMVSDSRTSWDADYFTTTKLCMLRGHVIGCAGDSPAIDTFLKWFANPNRRTSDADFDESRNFDAIVLGKHGLRMFCSSYVGMPVLDPFACIGSGGMAAKAVMLLGHTPQEAIEIACMCDKNSGLPFQRITLSEAQHAR